MKKEKEKQTGSNLLLSQDQLAVILEGVADGITVQDTSGRLLYANTAAARLMGSSNGMEILETPLNELMSRFILMDEAGIIYNLENLPGRRAMKGEIGTSEALRYLVKATGEERWATVKATPITGPTGKVEMVVNIFQDVTEAKQRERDQRFLAEASQLLSGSLDYVTTMKSVAALAVTNLADWCSVDILEVNGSFQTLAVTHRDPLKVELAHEVRRKFPMDWNSPAGSPNVIRTGNPEFYPEITDDMLQAASKGDEENLRILRELGLHSAFVLPLVARGRTLGALSLYWAESKHHYTEADIKLAEELAQRSAVAIDNARLYRESQNTASELERRVSQRTSQLQALINTLKKEISERKKAEEALRQSEAMLSTLVESAPDATILVNQDGKIMRVNAQAEVAFRYSREELVGRSIEDLLPNQNRKSHPFYRMSYYADMRNRSMGTGLQMYGRRKDGGEFPVDIMLNPVETPSGPQVICAIRDITERKQMEAELAEVQRRLIDSLEAERLFLAQELHDGAIQDLYTITYSIKELEDIITEGDPPVDNYLATWKEELRRIINLLRGICGELRPPTLAPFGLEKAIKAHAEHLNEIHPELRIELNLDPDRQILPERVRLALYRIYQHGVSNVLRHSGATVLEVNFKLDNQSVLLEIRDNGRGFELPARWIELARAGHLGLVGTAERAQAIGGDLKITTAPGQGTSIQVVLPNPAGRETVSPEAFPDIHST